MMEIYRRNIDSKLWALRILLIAGILIGYTLFETSHADYAYVLFFLLVCGTIISVTDINISIGFMEVRQYYVYGLFRRRWTIDNKTKIEIKPYAMDFEDSGSLHTDEWYDIFFLAIPRKKITITKFTLSLFDKQGKLHRIKLMLNEAEQAAIRSIFSTNRDLAESIQPEARYNNLFQT